MPISVTPTSFLIGFWPTVPTHLWHPALCWYTETNWTCSINHRPHPSSGEWKNKIADRPVACILPKEQGILNTYQQLEVFRYMEERCVLHWIQVQVTTYKDCITLTYLSEMILLNIFMRDLCHGWHAFLKTHMAIYLYMFISKYTAINYFYS